MWMLCATGVHKISQEGLPCGQTRMSEVAVVHDKVLRLAMSDMTMSGTGGFTSASTQTEGAMVHVEKNASINKGQTG